MTMPPQDSAATIVASAMDRTGLSQKEFGRLIQRSQSIVSKYLGGKVEVPGSVVMQCMEILRGGQAADGGVSSSEVARLIEHRLEGPRFSRLREALVNLIESVSAVPGGP